MRIRSKLILLLLAVGTVSLLVPTMLAYRRTETALRKGVLEQLVSLRESKARHIESYMGAKKANVELLAADVDVTDALLGFRAALANLPSAEVTADLEEWFFELMGDEEAALAALPESGPLAQLQELYGSNNPFPKGQKDELLDARDGSAYTRIHKGYHQFMRRAKQTFGFTDIILLDARTGVSLYSVEKKADFATDLLRGPFRNLNSAAAVRGALNGSTSFADFEYYAPNDGLPTAFIATPVRIGGAVEGVLLGLIPIDEITKVMTGGGKWSAEGLGMSGETFLVGSDLRMRSDSRFLTEDVKGLVSDLRAQNIPERDIEFMLNKGTSVLTFRLDSEAARLAVKGESGAGEFIGYRGKPILAAFGMVNVQGLKWGIVCKREAAEALEPLRDIAINSLLTFLGLFGGVTILSIIASQGLVRPLERLANAARRKGAGEKGLLLAVERSDELGELTQAFNSMVEQTERFEETANRIRRNIVHDLKTPVTVMKGMGETLLEPEISADPELRKEMAEAIVAQSDRLLDDLKDILTPIDEHYVPDKEEFDLALLLERIAALERHAKRSGAHSIHVGGTAGPALVLADRRKIARVVENLLSNAIKYSPGDEKNVWIDLALRDGLAVVTVTDEGLGMSTEELYKVLTEGGRVADHAQFGIEGTGLGLGSVRQILLAHGGELLARSEKGVGSTFTAQFPIR